MCDYSLLSCPIFATLVFFHSIAFLFLTFNCGVCCSYIKSISPLDCVSSAVVRDWFHWILHQSNQQAQARSTLCVILVIYLSVFPSVCRPPARPPTCQIQVKLDIFQNPFVIPTLPVHQNKNFHAVLIDENKETLDLVRGDLRTRPETGKWRPARAYQPSGVEVMDVHNHQSLTFQSCQASDDTYIFPTTPPPSQNHNLAVTTREKRVLLQLYFLKCTRAQICLHLRTAGSPFLHAVVIYHSSPFHSSPPSPALHLPSASPSALKACLAGISPPGTTDLVSVLPPQQDAALPEESACSIQMIHPSLIPNTTLNNHPNTFPCTWRPISVIPMRVLCSFIWRGATAIPRCPDASPHLQPFVSIIPSGLLTILPLGFDGAFQASWQQCVPINLAEFITLLPLGKKKQHFGIDCRGQSY